MHLSKYQSYYLDVYCIKMRKTPLRITIKKNMPAPCEIVMLDVIKY